MTNALCNLNSKVFSSNVCFEYPSFEIASMPDSKGIKQFEVAARTCYRSESKITKDISSGENLLNRILKHEHLAMLEFLPDLVVKIRTNRGVSQELVRHRMCSFAQESTRYVKYDLVPFLLPWWSTATHLYESPQIVKNSLFISSCLSSAQFYRERVISGCSAQEARGSLNNDLATYINVKANIREWLHIFSLRSAKEAHPDMRLLVCGIACWLNENNPLFSRIFNHYQPIKHNITWFKNNFFIELLEGAQYIINYVDADTGTDACDQWEK